VAHVSHNNSPVGSAWPLRRPRAGEEVDLPQALGAWDPAEQLHTAPLDLSDVVLVAVKQIDNGKSDIGLGKPVGLVGTTAAGSGAKKDPKMVAFAEDQKVSFLESLLRTLLADDSLVQQARVNTPKQFTESPDFDDVGAVADNQGSHNKMADYFFSNSPGRGHLVNSIAKAFYEYATAS